MVRRENETARCRVTLYLANKSFNEPTIMTGAQCDIAAFRQTMYSRHIRPIFISHGQAQHRKGNTVV